MLKAQAAFLAGDYKTAEDAFGRAADALPDGEQKARARYWRGLCRLKRGMPRLAARDFEAALNLSNEIVLQLQIKEGMADCTRAMERYEEAAKLYESLARQYPPSSKKTSLLQRRAECLKHIRPAAAERRAPAKKTTRRAASYYVQLGVFADRARADRLARMAQAKGFRCVVRLREVRGRRLYAVRTGTFFTKAGAERQAQALRQAGFEAVVAP